MYSEKKMRSFLKTKYAILQMNRKDDFLHTTFLLSFLCYFFSHSLSVQAIVQTIWMLVVNDLLP